MSAHDPGALHELELALDVGVEAYEVQAGFHGRLQAQCLFGRHLGPIFTTSSQQPMEAGGCHEIARPGFGVEAQGPDQPGDEAIAAGRQISGAWIGAADVRADRASMALWVGVECEGVEVGRCNGRRWRVAGVQGEAGGGVCRAGARSGPAWAGWQAINYDR